MKLPRRQFLHLTAGAAALPPSRAPLGAKLIHRSPCALLLNLRRVVQTTSSRA